MINNPDRSRELLTGVFFIVIIMDKELPKIEKYCAEFPGETSCVYIYFGDITVRVEVPDGHLVEDINVDISTGNGWINV